jgi:hypothetical protein
VGSSFVSAITHTPASGPFELVTTPEITSASTAAGRGCAAPLGLGRASVRTIATTAIAPNAAEIPIVFQMVMRIAASPYPSLQIAIY